MLYVEKEQYRVEEYQLLPISRHSALINAAQQGSVFVVVFLFVCLFCLVLFCLVDVSHS